MTTSQPNFDFTLPRPEATYDYAGERLEQHWERLHQGMPSPGPKMNRYRKHGAPITPVISPGPSAWGWPPARMASTWRTRRW